MIWDKEKHPIWEAYIIDPWPKQAWNYSDAKSAIQTARKPYQLFYIQYQFASYFDAHGNPKAWKRLDPDQLLLFEAYRHYDKYKPAPGTLTPRG
jgi:hypothetical protein